MMRKTFSGSKLWTGTSHRTLENVRLKTSIRPTKKTRKKKENSSLAGFYPLQSVNNYLLKHVNPSLAAEKTISETSMTVIVVYSYLNSDFSHCILGGGCRAYLPELAEWPNKSST